MASHVAGYTRATASTAFLTPHTRKHSLISTIRLPIHSRPAERSRSRDRRGSGSSRVRVSDGGDSFLDMWKKAVERDRRALEFQKIAENTAGIDGEEGVGGESPEMLERKSNEFQKILEVSREERDRIQRMQVIDRAAAAIATARAILKDSSSSTPTEVSGDSGNVIPRAENGARIQSQPKGYISSSLDSTVPQSEKSSVSQSGAAQNATPGPNFWSWTPPESDRNSDDESFMKLARQVHPHPINVNPVMEKDQTVEYLSIPLESKVSESNHYPSLPPLQSLMEVSSSTAETTHVEEKHELGVQFSAHAAEAAHALNKVDETASQGVNPDGSRWWKETGIEQRPDGVVCRWTLTRGVSADKSIEWEDKYWEAADQFEYKELGSEKSGRDASGNVWREFWKESMSKDQGLLHLEKTADKWGKNGEGTEWQEKWWEHYDESGQSEKWAHKWCSIDPSTQLEAGHAHVWHERWGEKYDGTGASTKYTDKWAERSEGDGWTKWGDKWDEHFNTYGHGVKQGETWWQGKYGERWNRTWGEGHNGSGWVHKYGKSSSGEHWDTHEQQDTWYERYPHFGFQHCFDNSVQLREVRKPSEYDGNEG